MIACPMCPVNETRCVFCDPHELIAEAQAARAEHKEVEWVEELIQRWKGGK